MDALLAEISKKRQLINKAVSSGSSESIGPSDTSTGHTLKFAKVSEIERVRREESRIDFESDSSRRKPSKHATSIPTTETTPTKRQDESAAIKHDGLDGEEEDDGKYKNIPDEELRRRFRAFGQPVKLFGETHKQRVGRLKALEMNQSETATGDGQRNIFKSHVSQVDNEIQLQDLKRSMMNSSSAHAAISSGTNMDDGSAVDGKRLVFEKYEREFPDMNMRLAQQDPGKCCSLLYVFFKKLMHEWEQELDSRPDDFKRSAAGKRDTITHRQTVDYIRPLFKMLKQKNVESDVLEHLAQIGQLMFEREYIKASEAYLRLSIGNAPWPIGVTGVNIHERSAHDKIKSNQVAHVLNDETQRKWVQSIKRLMTFSQGKYPPEDLSKMMG